MATPTADSNIRPVQATCGPASSSTSTSTSTSKPAAAAASTIQVHGQRLRFRTLSDVCETTERSIINMYVHVNECNGPISRVSTKTNKPYTLCALRVSDGHTQGFQVTLWGTQFVNIVESVIQYRLVRQIPVRVFITDLRVKEFRGRKQCDSTRKTRIYLVDVKSGAAADHSTVHSICCRGPSDSRSTDSDVKRAAKRRKKQSDVYQHTSDCDSDSGSNRIRVDSLESTAATTTNGPVFRKPLHEPASLDMWQFSGSFLEEASARRPEVVMRQWRQFDNAKRVHGTKLLCGDKDEEFVFEGVPISFRFDSLSESDGPGPGDGDGVASEWPFTLAHVQSHFIYHACNECGSQLDTDTDGVLHCPKHGHVATRWKSDRFAWRYRCATITVASSMDSTIGVGDENDGTASTTAACSVKHDTHMILSVPIYDSELIQELLCGAQPKDLATMTKMQQCNAALSCLNEAYGVLSTISDQCKGTDVKNTGPIYAFHVRRKCVLDDLGQVVTRTLELLDFRLTQHLPP
jgi:hypothetical protein